MTNGSTATAAAAAASNEEEVWSRDDHDWALTYNIWHMLPWMERKDMASKYGCKTIGEFEEYMSIRRALEAEKKAYPNDEAYVEGLRQRNQQSEDKKLAAIPNDQDDQDDSLEEDEKLTLLQPPPNESCKETNPDDSLSNDELVKVGGFILSIPEELAHAIFAFLSVDTYATLALVSPHWKHLCRSETVYRKLCERIYLHQSKRRVLNVMRFGGSYRTMLCLRPRVRTGLYVMRYAQVKQIQRDMWCEIPIGAILESVYYRYVYFQEDGRVLYALTNAAPHEMVRRFLKVLRHNDPDRAIVWGTFQVQGKHVVVTAKQEWQYVKLELTILPESHWGRFGALIFDRHLTSSSGNFDEYAWPNDIHVFQVPSEVFRYVDDRRLN